ncbi:MAG: hypothetical protein ACFE0R_20880, partial [Salinarimonas sp.]
MSPASPKTAKSEEPTMEDILASIRRIIADDQAAGEEPADEPEPDPQPKPQPQPKPAASEPEEDASAGNSQSAVDDMFGDDPEPEEEPEDEEEVLDLGSVAEPVAKPPREPSPLDLDHEDIDFREAGHAAEPDFDALPEPEMQAFEEEPEPDALAFDEPEPFVPPPMPEPPPRRGFDQERLLSEATDAAVGGSFNMLAHAVLSNQ